MRDIQLILERWGVWVSCGESNLGYPRIAAGFSRLLPARRRHLASCSDNDGLFINEAMIRLSKYDEYLCTLIEWHYIKHMTLREMASKLGISHNHVSVRIQTAEGWIDGCLHALNIRLEMDQQCSNEPKEKNKVKKVV
ncbi:antiterminator Q family protein [Pantoea endophytica]|uniref:Antiterminator Q family protein n=1 Tax=Pantoea sp. BJ2 TaxID=3141322 RepID=A0AAU7U3I5_9GAMM